MDMKPLSTSQQIRHVKLQYLKSATWEIEMLQKELEKLEKYLHHMDKIAIHNFVKVAFKIRNISDRCAEIMYNAKKLCYESFTNISVEID